MHDFKARLRRQQYAPKTIRVYANYMVRAEQHVGNLKTATTDDLQRFLDTLPPRAPSLRMARKALIAYYKTLGGKNPAIDLLVPPEPDRLPRPIAENEHPRYLTAADSLTNTHRVVGYLWGYTGARFSEIRFARWIDFELRTDPRWRVVGKGSGRRGPKERVVPLNSQLVDALRAHRATTPRCEYVLPGQRHPWIGENHLYDLHHDICTAAGLEGTVPHQLRHTVITLALDRTGDMTAVKDFVGHSSFSSLQKYAGLLPGRLRSVSESLDAPPAAAV